MKNVAIGFLGTQLDMGRKRRWKPTVSLCSHPDLILDRLELLYDEKFNRLAFSVQREIEATSPGTEVLLRRMDLDDPWDFQEVYGKLFDFARDYGFDEDRERYHVHLTTGTHVAQICWFLLTESRHVPARLIQTGPPRGEEEGPGTLDVIDLDLSRYNAIQQRFDLMAREFSDLLKGGIETKSEGYNALIDKVELVASTSDAPILLLGESGTGKTELAQRIYELKLQRRRVKGRLVQINCATLKGSAVATLFGQRRSYTGQAGTERNGLLREADGGVLFLDEVDELGLDEQAVLLHAIETGRYYPLGSDHEISSRFQVIAGANRDLAELAAEGRFRPDLLSRLNMWAFRLPALRERREDVEVNLHYELAKAARELGVQVGFNADAAEAYLKFARDPASTWPGNFRDFSGSILRLCTLAPRGRITRAMVEDEIETLQKTWRNQASDADLFLAEEVMGEAAHALDPFDLVQLAHVVRTCRKSPSLSAAGRTLFAMSRGQKKVQNDADRLRKYLQKFGLDWASLAV